MKLPLNDVLKYFNITYEQYFNLALVPFPVVDSRGYVVHYEDRITFFYNEFLKNSLTNHYERRGVFTQETLSTFFVDFGVYKFCEESTTFCRNSIFTIKKDSFKSSSDLIMLTLNSITLPVFFNKETGFLQEQNLRYRKEYPFTDLDLVNTVHPWYNIIKTNNQILFFDANLNSIQRKNFSVPLSSQQPFIGEQKMSSVNSSLTPKSVIDTNKQALITATKLEVGSLALNVVSDQIVKALPAPLQMLISDNPLVKIAIANLVNVIILQTGFDDKRILAVNDAMLTVSWLETIKTFDFKSIIDNALSGIPSSKIDTLIQAQEN